MPTNRQQGYNAASQQDPITGTLGLVGVVIAIWALVSAARITLSGLSLVLSSALPGDVGDIVQNCLLSGIVGIFAGVATAILRSSPRKPSHLSKSFVSALFSSGLSRPRVDAVLIGRGIIGGVVGFLVGAISGSSGIISVPQLLGDSAGGVIQGAYYPVHVFIGGGFGGPGGTSLWGLLALIIVLIVAAIIVGLCSGFLLHIVVAGLGGMTKAATKTYIEQVLEERTNEVEAQRSHPIRAGMARGIVVGCVTGVIQAICTALGVVQFYK